ncbi:hypothetical protein Tco_0410509 [Tanacetum coccineum]
MLHPRKHSHDPIKGINDNHRFQEKAFANVALKNELRKLKGNSVDTKFAKPSILGKPVLQPPRNQSVVRQPNAFKSERPNFSKPQFASQVDVINVLSKPVTPHYFPKVREYVLAKRHHVIAPGSSRNSQEEPYGLSVMAHNHYLEKARKRHKKEIGIQDLALFFNEKMTSVHISSSLALQRHMASADNTSDPVPQSKERCTLQYALLLEEEKSSCL